MGQVLHGSATTTEAIRRAIQHSQASLRALAQANRLLGGSNATLVVDDTALPKKSTHSVGVGRQYAGLVGMKANCQASGSLTLSQDEVPIPLALLLLLPDSWINDPHRLQRASAP